MKEWKTRNSHGLLQLGREALAYCQCASALISGNKALFVSVDLIGEKNQVILEFYITGGVVVGSVEKSECRVYCIGIWLEIPKKKKKPFRLYDIYRMRVALVRSKVLGLRSKGPVFRARVFESRFSYVKSPTNLLYRTKKDTYAHFDWIWYTGSWHAFRQWRAININWVFTLPDSLGRVH